jgi:hypothetical protein
MSRREKRLRFREPHIRQRLQFLATHPTLQPIA